MSFAHWKTRLIRALIPKERHNLQIGYRTHEQLSKITILIKLAFINSLSKRAQKENLYLYQSSAGLISSGPLRARSGFLALVHSRWGHICQPFHWQIVRSHSQLHSTHCLLDGRFRVLDISHIAITYDSVTFGSIAFIYTDSQSVLSP